MVQHADINHTGIPGAGGSLPSGTAFPGGPADNDLFYRTDHDLLYFYNGTYWLTLTEYQYDLTWMGSSGISADTNAIGLPIIADGDTYLTTFFGTTYLSATAIWVMSLFPVTTAAADGTLIASVTTSGDASGTVIRKSATINALVANTTYMLRVVFDEQSGSASFLGAFSLRYRRRAT